MLQLQTPQEAARWLQARVTGTLRTDSRLVRPGDGFLAWGCRYRRPRPCGRCADCRRCSLSGGTRGRGAVCAG